MECTSDNVDKVLFFLEGIMVLKTQTASDIQPKRYLLSTSSGDVIKHNNSALVCISEICKKFISEKNKNIAVLKDHYNWILELSVNNLDVNYVHSSYKCLQGLLHHERHFPDLFENSYGDYTRFILECFYEYQVRDLPMLKTWSGPFCDNKVINNSLIAFVDSKICGFRVDIAKYHESIAIANANAIAIKESEASTETIGGLGKDIVVSEKSEKVQDAVDAQVQA